MTMAEECIDEQSAIEHEWKIQVRCYATSFDNITVCIAPQVICLGRRDDFTMI